MYISQTGWYRRLRLANSDFIEGAPLRFHPHVGVARKHGAGDVPGDAHDHLVARARFRQFRNQRVTVIVPSSLFAQKSPVKITISKSAFYGQR
jgi:hypothetical protein